MEKVAIYDRSVEERQVTIDKLKNEEHLNSEELHDILGYEVNCKELVRIVEKRKIVVGYKAFIEVVIEILGEDRFFTLGYVAVDKIIYDYDEEVPEQSAVEVFPEEFIGTVYKQKLVKVGSRTYGFQLSSNY